MIIIEDILAILTAIPATFGMAVVILIGGLVLGTILTLGQSGGGRLLRGLSRLFIWYVRGIPLLVHIYIVYYMLSDKVPAVVTLITAYVLYSGATQAENIRTALASVPRSQYEAAYCVGMTGWQAFRRIIFPQMFVVILPILLNVFLNIIKGLSLAFTISVVDLLARAKICIAENGYYLEAYIAVALVYWGLSVGATKVFEWLEIYFYRKQGRSI